MSLSKSKCWYSNNCLHFLKCAVPLPGNWHEMAVNYRDILALNSKVKITVVLFYDIGPGLKKSFFEREKENWLRVLAAKWRQAQTFD